MFWAAVLASVLINTVIGELLPLTETFMLVIHILGFFAVLIPLVYVSLLPVPNSYNFLPFILHPRQARLTQCRWRLRRSRPMMLSPSSQMEVIGLRKACPLWLVSLEVYMPCSVSYRLHNLVLRVSTV